MKLRKGLSIRFLATIAVVLMAAGLVVGALTAEHGLSGSLFLGRHDLADGGVRFELEASYTVILGALFTLGLIGLVAHLRSKNRPQS
ncbi:hypothetical protein AB0N65_07090 [Paenarthrobacter sp. NPDC089322]|uniref:hypothetical protein n=1 Tax=Paenarthrobacter sp. NPDC089322 TaxID=3155065 RepID=UPI00342CB52C